MISEQNHFVKIFFWPFCSKHVINVIDAMILWLMWYDLMKYAQVDNEDEFKKTLLILLKKHDFAIINESLKHSRS